MQGYEYIRLEFDYGDLGDLNKLSGSGWRVVDIQRNLYNNQRVSYWALMERPLPKGRDKEKE